MRLLLKRIMQYFVQKLAILNYPSEWIKWTNKVGAFHHKIDIFDVGPVWIFAPTACPRTGPIPTQTRSS